MSGKTGSKNIPFLDNVDATRVIVTTIGIISFIAGFGHELRRRERRS